MKIIQVNEQLRQIMDRDMQEDYEKFKQKCIERLKQTGEYDELVKRRQAVLDAQKSKAE
jgi:chloramphenicol O-acetyltransferase